MPDSSCSRWEPLAASPAPGSYRECCVWGEGLETQSVAQTGAEVPSLAPVICPILPQGAAASHGGAGRLLRGWVCPGNGPPSSCCVVAMLLEEQSPVKTQTASQSVAAAFLLPANTILIILLIKLTVSGSRESSSAYLGLKPLSASR